MTTGCQIIYSKKLNYFKEPYGRRWHDYNLSIFAFSDGYPDRTLEPVIKGLLKAIKSTLADRGEFDPTSNEQNFEDCLEILIMQELIENGASPNWVSYNRQVKDNDYIYYIVPKSKDYFDVFILDIDYNLLKIYEVNKNNLSLEDKTILLSSLFKLISPLISIENLDIRFKFRYMFLGALINDNWKILKDFFIEILRLVYSKSMDNISDYDLIFNYDFKFIEFIKYAPLFGIDPIDLLRIPNSDEKIEFFFTKIKNSELLSSEYKEILSRELCLHMITSQKKLDWVLFNKIFKEVNDDITIFEKLIHRPEKTEIFDLMNSNIIKLDFEKESLWEYLNLLFELDFKKAFEIYGDLIECAINLNDKKSNLFKRIEFFKKLNENFNLFVLKGLKSNTISENFDILTKISGLKITKEFILIIEDIIPKFPNLVELDLSNLKLDKFPINIFQLKKLEKLNLNDNNIEALPENLNELKHLKEFLITANKLNKIPSCINEMDLNIFDVSKNPIKIAYFYGEKKQIKIARLSNLIEFKLHKKGINSVFWSPNGNYIISGSYDTFLKIFDIEKKITKLTLSESNSINSVVWSNDGNTLIYATNSNIKFFSNGQNIGNIETEYNYNPLLTNKEDRELAVSCKGGIIKIYSFKDLKELITLTTESSDDNYIDALDWNFRINTIIAGTSKGNIIFWNRPQEKPIKKINLSNNGISSISWEEKSDLILVSSKDNIYAMKSDGEILSTHNFNGNGIEAISWHFSGKYFIVSFSNGTLELFSEDFEKISTLVISQNCIESFNWHPNGKGVVCGDSSGYLYILENIMDFLPIIEEKTYNKNIKIDFNWMVDINHFSKIIVPINNNCGECQLTEDGKFLLYYDGYYLIIIENHNDTLLNTIKIDKAAIHPKNHLIVFEEYTEEKNSVDRIFYINRLGHFIDPNAEKEKILQFYNIDLNQVIQQLKIIGPKNYIWNPVYTILFIESSNMLKILEIDSNSLYQEKILNLNVKNFISFSWSPSGDYFIIILKTETNKEKITLWDKTGKFLYNIGLDADNYNFSWSMNDKISFLYQKNRNLLEFWDVISNKKLGSFNDIDSFYSSGLTWNTSNEVAIKTSNKNLYIISTRLMKIIKKFDQIEINKVAWSPNNNILAIALKNNHIHLFDISNVRITQIFSSHNDNISVLTWFPNNTSLISCSDDNKCYFWSIYDNNEIFSLFTQGSKINFLKFLPSLKEILSINNEIRFWDVEKLQSQYPMLFNDFKDQKIQIRKDYELLNKFLELLEICHSIKMGEVAEYLGISDKELMKYLIKWKNFGFKLNAGMIIKGNLEN